MSDLIDQLRPIAERCEAGDSEARAAAVVLYTLMGALDSGHVRSLAARCNDFSQSLLALLQRRN